MHERICTVILKKRKGIIESKELKWFFANSIVGKSINSTFITLVPKMEPLNIAIRQIFNSILGSLYHYTEKQWL
jgi:hypothetical protein